jgi:hypothetical protein
MRRPLTWLIAASAFVLVVPTSLAAASGTPSGNPHNVAGTWQEVVPVLTTAYAPTSPTDPTTGTFDGVGSSLWRGTWNGVTHYTATGTANLVTGAGSGTLDETFVGRSADGGTGTLTFAETFTITDTGAITINARIVKGTQDFIGSKGQVMFTGTQLGAVSGGGSYSGVWVRPHA